MPFVRVDHTRLFYRLEGQPGQPVLVLAHSIGCDHGMWAQQSAALSSHFQVLRYDSRGHGASDTPHGEYSVEQLGQDLVGLADALGIGKFAFCGLSLGGAVGQWLALHAPHRLSHLILASTSPQFGARENWEKRIQAVREGGMAAILDLATQRFFCQETIAGGGPTVPAIRSVLLGTDPAGYIGCCAALRDFDSSKQLRDIQVPTLVITGDRDVSTPWSGHGEILAREIPQARALHLSAAHLCNLERPRSFNAALWEFLLPAPTQTDPLAAGFKVRRAVLGDAHVERSMAATTDLTRNFQELITRYAWGSIWARPGLDRRTRRLLVLSMMAALGRWEEFRLHFRTGMEHELELCDLEEVLLQTAIYAGVPAANTGFHVVSEELAETKSK